MSNYDPKTEPGTLTLHIRTDSAAFHDEDGWNPAPELATILAHIAHRIENNHYPAGTSHTIHDSNGNDVGRIRINHPEEVQP